MGAEVFWDTSGFFALLNPEDDAHAKAREWVASGAGKRRALTTEWVIGETCTLLIARHKPHLVGRFLDRVSATSALTVVNPDHALLTAAKIRLRRDAERGYSFVDCISFCLMRERGLREAFTKDSHFGQTGFSAILAD